MALLLHYFKLSITVFMAQCLNLKNHGINDSYYASSIAVYRNRAFLTLPRTSCYNNFLYPTLIEVKWNSDHQTLLPTKKLSYPSEKHQTWGKCNHLQNAVSLDMEVRKARLWVLDKGNLKCRPKLIIYNLYRNKELHSSEIELALDNSLSFVVVDSFIEFNPTAYIVDSRSSSIFVFSFLDKKYTQIINGFQNTAPINRLAISKTEPILYVTGDQSPELYSLNITDIRSTDITDNNSIFNMELKFIGNKLGPSGGITVDVMEGFNYYLTRDYVVLRWKTSKPVTAENHDVLLQSYELMPYVPHLFNGPQNSIWALISPHPPEECSNISKRRRFQQPDVPVLNSRIVKLSKCSRRGLLSNTLFITN